MAINCKSKVLGLPQARDLIKSLIRDFDNQLRLFPESGKKIDFVSIGEKYSELIKGDYRFLFKVKQDVDSNFRIDVLMICHQRMDYETLLRQRHITKLIR